MITERAGFQTRECERELACSTLPCMSSMAVGTPGLHSRTTKRFEYLHDTCWYQGDHHGCSLAFPASKLLRSQFVHRTREDRQQPPDGLYSRNTNGARAGVAYRYAKLPGSISGFEHILHQPSVPLKSHVYAVLWQADHEV